jgi:hypothetical protein
MIGRTAQLEEEKEAVSTEQRILWSGQQLRDSKVCLNTAMRIHCSALSELGRGKVPYSTVGNDPTVVWRDDNDGAHE